jgi:uncharacterized OsmC-like protein
MKAVIESLGQVASRARVGAHELVFDQPATVPGGQDRGPSPLDAMAIAVAACAHYYAAAFLYARGLPTEQLTVEVDTEKERAPVPRIGRLSLTVHVPPGLTERQRAAVASAIKSCPAYGTLQHPPSVELNVEVDDEAAAPRAQTA